MCAFHRDVGCLLLEMGSTWSPTRSIQPGAGSHGHPNPAGVEVPGLEGSSALLFLQRADCIHARQKLFSFGSSSHLEASAKVMFSLILLLPLQMSSSSDWCVSVGLGFWWRARRVCAQPCSFPETSLQDAHGPAVTLPPPAPSSPPLSPEDDDGAGMEAVTEQGGGGGWWWHEERGLWRGTGSRGRGHWGSRAACSRSSSHSSTCHQNTGMRKYQPLPLSLPCQWGGWQSHAM